MGSAWESDRLGCIGNILRRGLRERHCYVLYMENGFESRRPRLDQWRRDLSAGLGVVALLEGAPAPADGRSGEIEAGPRRQHGQQQRSRSPPGVAAPAS